MTEDTFDLDRACAEAMERLHAYIDYIACKAQYGWAKDCYERQLREEIARQIQEMCRLIAVDRLFAEMFGGSVVRSDFLENRTMEHL